MEDIKNKIVKIKKIIDTRNKLESFNPNKYDLFSFMKLYDVIS